jgi:predicted alpha/beta-hydrolase family hydrolase
VTVVTRNVIAMSWADWLHWAVTAVLSASTIGTWMQLREGRRTRRDDSAARALKQAQSALLRLRRLYQRKRRSGRLRPQVRDDALEDQVMALDEAIAQSLHGEALGPLAAAYQDVGGSYAAKDPDVNVEEEAAAFKALADEIERCLRRSYE